MLVVVVALAAGLVLWKSTLPRDPGASGSGSAASEAVDRTVGLLRDKDPVCDEWGKYADELAEKEKPWAKVDATIPATRWTTEERQIFVEVGAAMSNASNQFAAILPNARDVVLQELIAQTITYLAMYVRDIPSYLASNALIAGVASNFSNAVTFMCTAVPLVRAKDDPYDFEWSSTVHNPTMLSDFMPERDFVCPEFVALLDRQSSMLEGWTAGDSSIPADQWSPQEWALNRGVQEVLTANLAQFRNIANQAEGRVTGDLIATHNAYLKAFVTAIPTYIPGDIKLWKVVVALAGGISAACEARL